MSHPSLSQPFRRWPHSVLTLASLLLGQSAVAASPFLLPEQFDIDPRTSTIAIQSGIAGDNFFVSNRNFKTDYQIQSPDGSSKTVPAAAVLTKFNVVETDVSAPGTYSIQTSNSAPAPTRYALIDGQWLRVMVPRANADKPAGDKAAGDKASHDKPKAAGMDGMNMAAKTEGKPEGKDGKDVGAAPKAPAMIRADQLPADAKVIVSNTDYTALTYVTKGAPTPLTDFSGKGFEVRPLTHPSEAYATDGFSFAVRLDGKPLAGQSFSVTRGASSYDKDAKRDRPPVVTDSQGIAKVSFDQPGVYLIGTSYPAQTRDRSVQPPSDVVSFGLTIEVAP